MKQFFFVVAIVLSIFFQLTPSWGCMAGVEFLIKVNPAIVDKNFYQQFSTFSQKIDDMAYFILKRNSTLALEKYNLAYNILFNIYQKYFQSPPPIFKDKKTFQQKLDYFTKKLSSFKDLIKNQLFSSASENLKLYVKEINSFLNPTYQWKKLKSNTIQKLSPAVEEDLLFISDYLIKSFAYNRSISPKKIKLGRISFDGSSLNEKDEFQKLLQNNKANFSFSYETENYSFTDLITTPTLQENLAKKYKFIFIGEVLSPEVVTETFQSTNSPLNKDVITEKAIFRYKIISLQDLSMVDINEMTIGVKTEKLVNTSTHTQTTVKSSLSNPHRSIVDSFIPEGSKCALDKINTGGDKNTQPTSAPQNKKQ